MRHIVKDVDFSKDAGRLNMSVYAAANQIGVQALGAGAQLGLSRIETVEAIVSAFYQQAAFFTAIAAEHSGEPLDEAAFIAAAKGHLARATIDAAVADSFGESLQ